MPGALPTRTSVVVTDTRGDQATIPAATETAAGVMTAEQVRQLEALWRVHQTQAGPTVIIEPSRPDPNLVTREQLVKALQAMPAPDVLPLERRIADLSARMAALPAPTSDSGPLRSTVEQIIEQMRHDQAELDSLGARVKRLESMLDALAQLAEIKAATADAA